MLLLLLQLERCFLAQFPLKELAPFFDSMESPDQVSSRWIAGSYRVSLSRSKEPIKCHISKAGVKEDLERTTNAKVSFREI